MSNLLSKLLAAALVAAAGSAPWAAASEAPGQGVVRVKLQRQVAQRVARARAAAAAADLSATGVPALDAAVQSIRGARLTPLFPPNPRYAAERAKYGIDQWYELRFDSTAASPREAAARLAATDGIMRAETVKAPKLVGSDRFIIQKSPAQAAAGAAMPFNDPRLPGQWHYSNSGTMAGTVAGADANVFNAWLTETGRPDVVVAIIDGGVDYTHEDLARNMLVNQAEADGTSGRDDDGNGYADDVYGWNFCTNSPQIYPHSHGTHVAGTVAAVNNNGIGVAGVAGGDGSESSGVRMISCQVFDSRSGVGEGDFAKAIVYAAERGATIAQCSWGWGEPDYYEQAVLDAINYFSRMARNDRMTGGLCIFAAGNNGATGNYYPGCIDQVLTVGSMTADGTVASYSNYGPWVDITAPGGLLDYGEQMGVLSTLPNNSYGWNEGTSMACPHVSGIAALVLSKYGSESMSPEMLRTQLETAVNDLYAANPGREGLYGSGYIDAAKALQFGDTSAPEAVGAVEILPAQNSITLEWTVPAAPYDYVDHFILYYSDKPFTEATTTEARTVNVDSRFTPSGKRISHTIDGLEAMTRYYMALRAVGRQGGTSAMTPVMEASTNAGPRMTVDKTQLDLSSGSDSFSIGNTAEGLLSWSYTTRTRSAQLSTNSLGAARPMNVKPYAGHLAASTVKRHTVVTGDFVREDYPKEMCHYPFVWAYIGDTDKSLPNSMAQYFTVDAEKYPDGFNLTTVRVDGQNGQNPVVEVYRGAAGITEQNRLCSFTPDWFVYGYNLALPEQFHFEPGESFWVVVHFDGDQEGYPLGLADGDGAADARNAYMSNDRGRTWTPLTQVLAGSSYATLECPTWAIRAISQNPDWSSVLTLTPPEGTVKQGETQTVEVKTDGQPLVNGSYNFNIYFDTNETGGSDIKLPVSLNVSGQKADVVFGKVVNFGDLLVGQQKTLTVEVFNRGYGNFSGSQWSAGIYSDKISSTSEHFAGPEYLSAGFPARSTTSFDITFAPKSAGSHTGRIVFTDRDGNEFSVMVQGVATDPARLTVEPATVNAGELQVGGEAREVEFAVKNTGNYPLQFVMPKYSDKAVDGAMDAAGVHRFGYVWASNLNGSAGAEYDGNPELIDAVDITASFTDQNSWSAPIDPGFKFPYYGKEYDRVYVNNYGGVAMSTGNFSSMSQAPVYPGHGYLEGTGWISAWGATQLQMGANSRVRYAKRDGKLVVSFENVLAVVYDQDYTPVSFHMVLSSNCDVEMFYDDYTPAGVFNQGRSLYVGLSDPDCADPLTVTSSDIANQEWTSDEERTAEGDRYMAFTAGTAVRIAAPAPNMIETIAPTDGLLAPGESVTVRATVRANEQMNAGETLTNLVINSNDLVSPAVLVPFTATITGDLKPALGQETASVDFGDVFRTAQAQRSVTVRNDGHADMTITGLSFGKGAFSTDFKAPFTVKARQAKDIVVTMPTDAEGELSDVLTVTTDAGTLTAQLKGRVIGCPDMKLGYTELQLQMDARTKQARPLTIENTGNETLTYALSAGQFLDYNPDFATSKGTGYTYASNEDSEAVKFNWVDIVDKEGTEHNAFTYYNLHDYVAVDLPFDFPFYGKTYRRMYVYNTGFVSFTERTDEHMWPEPPTDFPQGSIYTNVIAPYWGLHTMDQTKSAGTYHRVSDSQAVVSFMEYGNSMNLGVCYQLILNADGSFKFQYKEDENNPNSIIYGTFGTAGISNEGATEGIRLPDRLIKFNTAVEFEPVVTFDLEPGKTATKDITVNADALAGDYQSAITVTTNIPGREKVTIPVSLTLNGKAAPQFSADVTVSHPAGWMSTDYSDPMVSMGAMYYGQVEIANNGTAPFTISAVENKGPQVYDEWFDEYTPAFYTFVYGDDMDWNGNPTGTKSWQMYQGMPVQVGEEGCKFAVPMLPGEQAYTPGEYLVPLVFHLEGAEGLTEKTVNVKFVVTPAPAMAIEGPAAEGLTVTGVAPDYVGTHPVTIANYGEGTLTGTARIDLSGRGESLDPDEGGGVAPAALPAPERIRVLGQGKRSIETFDVATESDNIKNLPNDMTFLRGLYHPCMPGNNAVYTYGSTTEYGTYKGATQYQAPAGGFNISHVYTIIKFGKVKDADYIVEIVSGDNPETGTVMGRGVYHHDQAENTDASYQVTIALNKPVFVPEGQDFNVVISYPAGEAFPAMIVPKEESVVTDRYRGYIEDYGWFDVAEIFKDQYGSLGYVASCIETSEGSEWASLPGREVAFTVEAGAKTELPVRLNAVSAPLEVGNTAMLVIKSDDPNMPLLNLPVVLSKNGMPVVSAPTSALLVPEGSEQPLEVTVSDPDGDAMTVTVADNGSAATLQSVTTANGAEATTDDNGTVSIPAGAGEATLRLVLAPKYGDEGRYSVTVTAVDSYGQEGAATVGYTVEHTNRAPQPADVEALAMQVGGSSDVISFENMFSDPDGDAMTYAVSVDRQDVAEVYRAETSAIFIGKAAGTATATVTATDAQGATASVELPIVVTETSGVTDITALQGVGVYPNPVAETLYVTMSEAPATLSYSIVALSGATVLKSEDAAMAGGKLSIDVSALPAGYYVLRLTADGKGVTLPVIKK